MHTIDVTGLAPEAVRTVEALVGLLRDKVRPMDRPSIFDLFGKAATLRSGEDIARQIQEEHDSWGEP